MRGNTPGMLGCLCPSEMHATYQLNISALSLYPMFPKGNNPCTTTKNIALCLESQKLSSPVPISHPPFYFSFFFYMFAHDVCYPSTSVSTLWGPSTPRCDPRVQELPPAAFPDSQKQEEQESAFAKEIIFLISGAPADRSKLS